MTEQTAWTIKRLLDWTSEFFTSREIEQARLAAEILLAESMDCQRIELYTQFDQEPSDDQKTVYRDWVKRHSQGEPVAYLVGHKEFYSLKFEVNSAVLIPRPETEHLVSETIDLVKQQKLAEPLIADVGTGSGCIAVTLAKQIESANITAIDISPTALEVARQNAETHDVSNRIHFMESDLFESLAGEQQFDLVVSNPPYIGAHESDNVDDSVKQYEPQVALFAPGADGTTVISCLLDQSSSRVRQGGFLLFEMSPIISQQCQQLVSEHGSFGEPRVVQDYGKLDRLIVTQRI